MNKRCVCFFLWIACAYTAGVQTANASRDKDSKTEIDNDQVIVRRNIHPPHAITPMHSHKAGVVVYLTDVRERSTSPDGSAKMVTRRAGEVVWAEARQHTLENLSNTPIEVIEIELKK